jgi:hypothetical protein
MATLAFRQQAYLSAKGDERTHTLRTVGPVILAKVGNRLVIADQPADQSHVNPSSNHSGIVRKNHFKQSVFTQPESFC